MNCFLHTDMTIKCKVNHFPIWKENAFRLLYGVNWSKNINDTQEDKIFQGKIPESISCYNLLLLFCYVLKFGNNR